MYLHYTEIKPYCSLISTDTVLEEGSVAAHNTEIYILHILVTSKLRKNAEVMDVLTGNNPQSSLIITVTAIKNKKVGTHNIELYILYILVN